MDFTASIIKSAPITIPLIIGYLLDLWIGDPYKMPHPIRVIGKIIGYMDKVLNKGSYRFSKGLIGSIVLIAMVWAILHIIQKLIIDNVWLYYPFATLMVFYGLANKSLIYEAKMVEKALTEGLQNGRLRLSHIVGRDTSNLSPNQIRRAVLETLSENLSDGVIAPLFYYVLGGIPLMFAYKTINTLDSMIGYKNDKYFYLGKFAARLDDVANYIPARLTAIFMVLVSWSSRGFLFIFKYGNKHASPNSGYPEAALAGILNCQLGGSNTYFGKVVNKPFIGENNREISSADLNKTFKINHITTALFVAIVVIIAIFC